MSYVLNNPFCCFIVSSIQRSVCMVAFVRSICAFMKEMFGVGRVRHHTTMHHKYLVWHQYIKHTTPHYYAPHYLVWHQYIKHTTLLCTILLWQQGCTALVSRDYWVTQKQPSTLAEHCMVHIATQYSIVL